MEKLILHGLLEYLQAGVVVALSEQDEEGQALLGQLLGVLERDLAHQRRALIIGPRKQLVVLVELTGLVELLAIQHSQVPEADLLVRVTSNGGQITNSGHEATAIAQQATQLHEGLVVVALLVVKVAEDDTLLVVDLDMRELSAVADNLQLGLGLLFDVLQERLGRASASVLFFRCHTVAVQLQRRVFVYVIGGTYGGYLWKLFNC
jgi:hypothetical protein